MDEHRRYWSTPRLGWSNATRSGPMRPTFDSLKQDAAAGNGLLDRRLFLSGSAGAALVMGGITPNPAGSEPLRVEPWMKVPGSPFIGYGQPSRFEDKVVRAIPAPPNPATQGVGTARTPLHLFDGMITPSGLHFERSHSGIPDIDPDRHRLVIHGLVRRPLVFTLEACRDIRCSRALPSSNAAATALR